MTNPVVTVIVQEAVSSVVFITGEVAKSGPVQIHGPLNIVQALAMAGGFNEWANKKDIRILRQGPAGIQTLHFNYQDAIDGETSTSRQSYGLLLLHRADSKAWRRSPPLTQSITPDARLAAPHRDPGDVRDKSRTRWDRSPCRK